MDLRGDTRFVEVLASSKASPCHGMSCHVMSCRACGATFYYRLASKVREGSGNTWFSAKGSCWLVLKADQVQEQGTHGKKAYLVTAFIQQQ